MKSEPMAVIRMTWNLSIQLPLAEAHKLQTLLTKAQLYIESGYTEREKFAYIEMFDVPPVEISLGRIPMFDATMLTHEEATAWRDAVRQSFEADTEAKAANAISPALWKGML